MCRITQFDCPNLSEKVLDVNAVSPFWNFPSGCTQWIPAQVAVRGVSAIEAEVASPLGSASLDFLAGQRLFVGFHLWALWEVIEYLLIGSLVNVSVDVLVSVIHLDGWICA